MHVPTVTSVPFDNEYFNDCIAFLIIIPQVIIPPLFIELVISGVVFKQLTHA